MAFAPAAFSGTVDEAIPGSVKLANDLAIQVTSAIIITGLLITVVTSFGESFVKIKGSLIYQNIELSNKPKAQFYVATIIPVIVYSTITFILSIIFMVAFDSLGLLGLSSGIVDWSNIQYGYLLLSLVTTITLGISISLLISSVSKNENTYTALTWAYLFLIFFFGGSSVPIFLIRGEGSLAAFTYLSFVIPNTFSNFLFVNSMVGQVTTSDIIDILDIVMPIALSIVFVGVRQTIVAVRK